MTRYATERRYSNDNNNRSFRYITNLCLVAFNNNLLYLSSQATLLALSLIMVRVVGFFLPKQTFTAYTWCSVTATKHGTNFFCQFFVEINLFDNTIIISLLLSCIKNFRYHHYVAAKSPAKVKRTKDGRRHGGW